MIHTSICVELKCIGGFCKYIVTIANLMSMPVNFKHTNDENMFTTLNDISKKWQQEERWFDWQR